MPTYTWVLEGTSGMSYTPGSTGSTSTSVVGSGLSTCGFSPIGLGTPTTNTQLVGPGYQQSAGGCVSSVLIAQGTKDYVYDDYGNEKPMSDTGQRIYILARTTYGSRKGKPEEGMRMPMYITDKTPGEVSRDVRRALRPVIEDGSATITAIEVETEGNKVLAIVRWDDNRLKTRGNSTGVPLVQ